MFAMNNAKKNLKIWPLSLHKYLILLMYFGKHISVDKISVYSMNLTIFIPFNIVDYFPISLFLYSICL